MTKVLVLKKRKDFVRVAKQGQKMVSPSMVLQAALSLSVPKTDEGNSAYLGYTVTKKIGKAHERNRTKRRLRAAAREIFPIHAQPGINYVLIGRFSTATIDFLKLKEEMIVNLKRINKFFRKNQKESPSDEKIIQSVSDSTD